MLFKLQYASHHLETLLHAESDSAGPEWGLAFAFLSSSPDAESFWSEDHTSSSKDLGNTLRSQSAISKSFFPNFDADIGFFTWLFHCIVICAYSKRQRN